ncbi:MAG: nuclear transport factor 2 family protein [Myxococcales bacterium]|nr:nuclear transport factor 2 family protein [Myxococcales bacterium]
MSPTPNLAELVAEVRALRDRVGDLEAREEIRQLTARYMQAMHDARFDDAVACFADDASYDHGILGELRSKDDIRHFYLEFMPTFEEAGGWSYDVLANPVIEVDGDSAEGRWFLLTLLTDPETGDAAWSIATLEYEYRRIDGAWKFHRNRCIHEHLLSPYSKGWGPNAGSKLPEASDGTPDPHFERLRAQGGKQRPGTTTRSIRGWTVPTLEPQLD